MQESIINSLRSSFARLPTKRKLVIGLVGAAVLVGIVSLVLWSSRPDYVVLFSDLSPEDMQSIEDELYAARVSYKHSADGTSIMVPSSDVYKMRLRLANKGVPEVGAIGFEGFDKTDFGMTDFVQQLKYQRALQVELARTISQIKEVIAARVHVVLPRQTVFTEREQPAKASVVLNLRPAARLERSQINGIVHLIASAVEGLQKENVTVLDTSGKMLSAPSEGAFVDNSQLEYQRTVESELESQVQNMLDRVLGYNKAAIQVAADIDFSTTETISETYDPDKTVVKSEQNVEYTSKGLAGGAFGTPGVTSNVTPQAGMPVPPGLPEYTGSDATTEYEVSKTIATIIQQPGKMTKLSVAVVLDNKTVEGASVPWTQQELKDVEDLVRNAVGVDTSRGDPQIEVRNIPFDTSLQQETAAAEKVLEREQLRATIMKAAIAIVIFVFLVFALRSVLRRRPAAQRLALPGPQAPVTALQPGFEGAAPEAAPAEIGPVARGALEIAESPAVEDKQWLLALLEREPEMIAQVIRRWLSDR